MNELNDYVVGRIEGGGRGGGEEGVRVLEIRERGVEFRRAGR